MIKARRTLLITAIIFLTPVLIAVILHQFPGVISFTGTKNNGTLIHPPRPIDTLEIDADDNLINKTSLEGRWTYLVFSRNGCDTDCQERLYKTRQVRHALGKDMDQAQRLLVSLDATIKPETRLLNMHSDMLIGSAVNFEQWRSLFDTTSGQPSETADIFIDHIYLIDPLGNLMMFYTKDIEGRLILKDLQQLVKVSWIKPK